MQRKTPEVYLTDSQNVVFEWYQILYTFGRRRWFIYKIVNHENLCKTIDEVLKIKEIKAIKIEILPDCEED